MKYKAKVGFCGLVSMRKGEVKEIGDKYVADDLLRAGYIEPCEEAEDQNKGDPEENAEEQTEGDPEENADEQTGKTKSKKSS